jgi:hypothetical protein
MLSSKLAGLAKDVNAMTRQERNRLFVGGILAVSILSSGLARAAGFDPNTLPVTCQDSLAQIQGGKAQFAVLGKAMISARKASDSNAFCAAARQIVSIIKAQSAQLDYCVGELASAKTTPQAVANQILTIKDSYRQMIDAAKNGQNDHMHCGLADQ